MTADPYAEIEVAFLAPATREATLALSESQRHALRQFWIGRATGELTTALSFEYMLEDLHTLSAPSVLTDLASSAIAEEHRHVDWCLRFAGPSSDGVPPRAEFAGTRPLEFEGASVRDNRILRTVFGCCFSETVAVHVLMASHREIALDSVRRLNHQHIAEEVNHARLGWALLAWPDLGPRDRSMIAAFVPKMTQITRALWLAPDRDADGVLHALGFLSRPLIAQACDEAFDTVIRPGLDQNGIAV
jgi:hypothetical protein